jgi:hypothetical protein
LNANAGTLKSLDCVRSSGKSVLMGALHSSVAIRAALSGLCSLLFFACATNADEVASSYKSTKENVIAGSSSYRVAPAFVRVTAGEFAGAVETRIHEGYWVIGSSEFTTARPTPLRSEAIAQGMHVGASVVIYSVQPASGGSQSRHGIAFLRLRGSSSGR